jgi:uncharacterized protein with ParB-like and HNH nuclease domain/predicted transport protein
MKAAENHLLSFLDGRKQFVIPIYQRTYSWTHEECEQLWNDIVRAAADDEIKDHFIGSIVYVQQGILVIARTPQFLVIDGQQRLTTLSLLLTALARAAHPSGESSDAAEATRSVTDEEIYETYLVNKHGRDEERYKLLLTRADKETLITLVDGRELPDRHSQRIVDNYRYFEDQIQRSGLGIDALYAGLQKLVIVDISLDRSHDNPQLIFESLNSTGLELSQADLIRNYVLMGLDVDEQAHLYNAYWYPMEKRLLTKTEMVPLFDRFMRDYLTVKSKSGTIPNIRDVYTSFKAYRRGQPAATMADIAADLYRYARYFIRLAFADSGDREIDAALADINTLKVDVAYPLLLDLYDDYEEGRLTRADFLAMLRLVESYVFRRAICGIPTNSLNNTFAHFRLQSVRADLFSKDSYRRFPSDAEFKAAFVVKDVYNFRSRNYLLRKLENADRREPITVEEYTIEHVMPQNENLSVAWRAELGPGWQEVHAKYLHTIGNLTLTGYNSELSDRPFSEKRHIRGGFDESPLRLNQSIARLEHWNAEQIERRAQLLADKAALIWAAPRDDPERLARLAAVVASIGAAVSFPLVQTSHAPNLQGEMLDLFEHLRKRILNLDASVREEFKHLYVAYKTTTNFVDVVPLWAPLRLSLNMRFDEIDDPKGLCKEVTNLGIWGHGEVEVGLSNLDQLDDVMRLIHQSFEKHRED